ncbi:hypothetical protein ACT3SQ_02320 [Brachybacterium sp. AOP42-C2-15]|uniref:hypothetical protein n=1 Tax=unclassified Brachybacterium TaxID=2623841 RepID=UPI003F8E24E1
MSTDAADGPAGRGAADRAAADGGAADRAASSGRPADERAARPARRVVISSVTGKPIPWDEPASPSPAGRAPQERRPILPDRVDEDAPEPGVDESNDARIAGDVPPHWGRGR